MSSPPEGLTEAVRRKAELPEEGARSEEATLKQLELAHRELHDAMQCLSELDARSWLFRDSDPPSRRANEHARRARALLEKAGVPAPVPTVWVVGGPAIWLHQRHALAVERSWLALAQQLEERLGDRVVRLRPLLAPAVHRQNIVVLCVIVGSYVVGMLWWVIGTFGLPPF